MVADQVFIVNTETEVVNWLWDAQSDFPLEGGHSWPRDWAHINDVEYIEEGQMEGRIMASLRNQDQVVFLDREEGLLEDWTLGSEKEHDVLHEQHNPDFIPESQGGPAILVADSENAQIKEFQREGRRMDPDLALGDDQIQWPRDADRLPNGNTLISDTPATGSLRSISPARSSGRSAPASPTNPSASRPVTKAKRSGQSPVTRPREPN